MKLPTSLVLGDRVKVKEGGFATLASLRGKMATVIVVRAKAVSHTIGLQFDKSFAGGHDCAGTAPNFPIFKHDFCRWGSHEEVEFIEHGPMIEPVSFDTKRQAQIGGSEDADEDDE